MVRVGGAEVQGAHELLLGSSWTNGRHGCCCCCCCERRKKKAVKKFGTDTDTISPEVCAGYSKTAESVEASEGASVTDFVWMVNWNRVVPIYLQPRLGQGGGARRTASKHFPAGRGFHFTRRQLSVDCNELPHLQGKPASYGQISLAGLLKFLPPPDSFQWPAAGGSKDNAPCGRVVFSRWSSNYLSVNHMQANKIHTPPRLARTGDPLNGAAVRRVAIPLFFCFSPWVSSLVAWMVVAGRVG